MHSFVSLQNFTNFCQVDFEAGSQEQIKIKKRITERKTLVGFDLSIDRSEQILISVNISLYQQIEPQSRRQQQQQPSQVVIQPKGRNQKLKKTDLFQQTCLVVVVIVIALRSLDMLEKSKLGLYFETILEIIEDKPNFLIPAGLYCIMIEVLFHQIAGYIFSNFEVQPLDEQKISFIAHINEVSTLTFLLFFKGNDSLSLVCFGIMQALMYFYFIYVGILTYLKNVKKYFFEQNKKTFRQLNQVLNIFFTFYWWLFFTPYIEINSGMLVCGDNSFLSAYRGKSCSGKPPILTILSVLGLILSITTAFIIVYFFRNYEFNEQNLLKRRFHPVILGQLVGRFLLTFFYYLNLPSVLVFKHIIAQIIGVSFLYDTLINWPFSNHTIANFYGCACCVFETAIILCNLWIFSNYMPASEFFYYLVFLCLLTSALMMQTWKYKYSQIMKFNENRFQLYYKQTDFFLEEIVKLLLDSQKDEQAKFKLFETLIYHIQVCKDEYCHCKKSNFKKPNNDLSEEDVFKLVDSIFKWALRQKILLRNLEEFEHLSLKYISYLAKYRNNTSRAYYELKALLSQRTDISFYFKIISKILSKAIENQMEQSYMKNNAGRDYREDLELGLVWRMEEFKQNFVPKMIKALEHKVSYWEKMKQGFNRMEDCMKYSIKKIRSIENLDREYQLELSRMNGDERSSFIFFKICSMFEILVKNQIVNAMKLEMNANELRKRDQSKSPEAVHNFKFVKQEIISFLVSYSKERGKIVSKKSAFTAKFFGYGSGEQESIKSINDLMPKFIAEIHNDLMENMNWKGRSKYIKGSIRSYCSDKSGFIYPIKIFLDHSFGHFDDFCLLSSILKVPTSNDYIVFDETGKILGISKQIFEKLFQQEKNLNIQKLYRTGYIFLVFKEIINQINISMKDISSVYSDQQVVQLTNTNKGFFNLNQNYDVMFDTFNQYLSLTNNKETDSNRLLITKKNQTKKLIINSSKFDQTTLTRRKSLNLLQESSTQFLSQFFEYFSSRKNDIQNYKNFSEGGSQNGGGADQYQVRLFFKYQLSYETLKYNENKQELKLFHLVLSDLAISKRRVGSAYQSNMSLNTYVNSTQIGGASSYRLKTFMSKGGDTDLGNSVKFSDENKNKEQQGKQSNFQPNKNTKENTQENVLDTNNQFENKFEQIDVDDEEWSETQKMSDSEDGGGASGSIRKKKHKNQQAQQQAQSQSVKKLKEKDKDNLENIQEAPNKEEDSNKQISVKNDSDENHKLKAKQIDDLNLSFQPTKQSTTQEQSKEPIQNLLDKSTQQAALNGSMINDSILNESNFQFISNNMIMNSSLHDDQMLIKNNLVAFTTTNRNGNEFQLFSPTSRNAIDESQRPVLKGGPEHLQAEFFSPTNNMRQLLDQDEIMITMDDQRNTQRTEPPPINMRFDNEKQLMQQYAQENHAKLRGDLGISQTGSILQPNLAPNSQLVVSGNFQDQELIKASSLNPMRESDQDNGQNEDLEKDYERIKKKRSLKDYSSKEGKKKKYSLKSEINIEDDMNQQQSLASHSSIRSSYGTQFVREILNSKRMPNAANNYNIIQKLFLISFLIIIVVNIFYQSQQITQISHDMDNYIVFANMTTSGAKGLFALIGLVEIYENLLTTNVAANQKLFQNYLSDASNIFQQSYLSIEDNFIINIDEIFTSSEQIVQFKDYDYLGQLSQNNISVLQLLYSFQNALMLASSSINSSSNTVALRVAYYQLRFNFQTFLERMMKLKDFQDSSINNSITYINSLYIVGTVISCVLCFMVVVASIPMVSKINLFKEKIILLVTRIKVDDADIEVSKYKQCIEELQDTNESYMSVDFFKIYTSRRRFHKRRNKGGEEELEFDDDLEHTYKVQQKNEGGQQIKQTVRRPKKKEKKSSVITSSNSKFKQNVISSKIFDQKLGLSKQFFAFLSYSLITMGFFIAILVYVVIKDNSITPSLNISRITLNTQYSMGSLYCYSELSAIENIIASGDPYYPTLVPSNRLTELGYQAKDITVIQQFNQDNIGNIYGDNIISSSSLSDIKNLYQNSLCNEFSTYSECNNFSEGISGYIASIFQLITTHGNLFSNTTLPAKVDVVNYLTSDEHQKLISEGYVVPDMAFYLFNKIIIDANVTLVNDMSLLVQIVFYTVGPIILIILVIFFYKQWSNLTKELNSLGFLLTLIPEEKISEEITLQMLKQIRSF